MTNGEKKVSSSSLQSSINSQEQKSKSGDNPNLFTNDTPYSKKIGTDEDAKNSVVWYVITFTLTLYACVLAILIIVDIFDNGGKNILTNIKESWNIFTPILTLAMGYMFGKRSKDENQKNTI